MSNLSPRRKRVTVLCASVAAMSGMGTLLHGHRIAMFVWLAFIAVALVYAMTEFAKLKKEEG